MENPGSIPVGVLFIKRKILKMIKIFIDDIRIPVEKDWIPVSTVKEAKNIIQDSDNFILSLDHDLGEKEGIELTTRPLLLWCIENNHIPQAAAIHSSNPVGVQWIKECLRYDFPHPIPIVSPPSWKI